MAKLPSEFADLESFTEWCLASEQERYDKRLASTMAEMQEFYDAAFGRLEDAIVYLDAGIGFTSQPVTVTITRDAGFVDPIDITWSNPNGSPVTPPTTSLDTTGAAPIVGNVSATSTMPGSWTLTVTATSGDSAVKDRSRCGRPVLVLSARPTKAT
jgi:hypothetical protein